MSLVNYLEIGSNCDNIGNKGINLGIMARNKVSVPQAYAVTSQSYLDFVSGVQDEIRDLIKTHDYETCYREIRNLFLRTNFNPDFESGLEKTVSQFPSGALYAVRSSGLAVVEGETFVVDSEKNSLAGQYESFLMVPTNAIGTAIKLCWASLFNARSLRGFKAKSNDYYLKSRMSVVVQEMVQATHCAVMMTQDPIEGQNILGIESSYGPCEILVSGRVDGDLLLYDKQSGRVVSQEIGDKETIIGYDIFTGENGNIREIPVQPNLRQVPALSPEQVKQLIEQGLKIEKIFGKPQDIEAAFVGDQLYILQTRNITTL